MDLEHSFTIPVPPEQAWPLLLDVQRMAPCMPGATVDSVDGDVVKGRIKVKVGPVSLTYSGSARFTERDEQARSVTLEASGKETRGAGTASATVRSSLADEGGKTRVVVHTTMSVTGRPAQFGRGVMAEVGGRIIEKFATNLAAQLAGGSLAEAGPAAGNGAGPEADASGPAAAPAAPGNPAPANSAAQTSAAQNSAAANSAPAATVPLEELQLPVRAYNSLRRVGIHTVDDLAARTETELLAIENLGPQTVREIRERLAGVGRELAERPQDGPPAADGHPADGQPSDGVHPRGVSSAVGTATDGVRAAGPEPVRAPQAARPPDEDAIDLLGVAGFPVLKRALPVAGAFAALLLVFLRARRRRRARA